MTSKPTLKLTCGNKTLDLNDQSRFWLGRDFVPPEAQISAQFALGTSANQFGGGSVVSTKAANVTLSFSIALVGSSSGQIGQAIRDINYMLNLAGDPLTPVYLEYNPNSDVPEPLWGQFGCNLRYAVVIGSRALMDGYLVGVRRATDVNLQITVTVNPFPIGKPQQLCAASGGIFEDKIGATLGNSRGVVLPEATSNYFHNPVFGHATYTTSWTIASDLLTTYYPRGGPSGDVGFVRVTCKGASSSFIQLLTLTVASHTMSFYVRRPDGGALSTSVVNGYFNGGIGTLTFRSVGNGWYLATTTGTASASSTAYGLFVIPGYTIDIAGFQVEAKAYPTPLCYGDLLGCTWSGTAHNSSSSRTAASAKILISGNSNNVLSNGAGTVRIIWRLPVANTHPNDMFIFSAGAYTRAYFKASDDKFYLTDNINTISSAAQTFSAGDVLVLHFVWGPGQLAIYKNGASIASGAAYTPPDFSGASLFLGTDSSAANNTLATFSFASFDVALTATQVNNDYANATAAITNGTRLESVPWFWTDDGDNILSIDTGKLPVGVVGGVPGDVDAITEIQGALSGNWNAILSFLLGNLKADEPVKSSDLLFDISGTVGAGDYGGQHWAHTAVAGYTPATTTLSVSAQATRQLNYHDYCLAIRLKAASAQTLGIEGWYALASASFTNLSQPRLIAAQTDYRLFLTKSQRFELDEKLFDGITGTNVVLAYHDATLTGTLATSIDYVAVVPRPTIILASDEPTSGGFVYKSGSTKAKTSSGVIQDQIDLSGDEIFELSPNKYNTLICLFCPNVAIDPVTTLQATFSKIVVTPRYQVL